MKEFNQFSKEDQRLICEAMQINNHAVLSAINGIIVDSDKEFRERIENMSFEAKEFIIEMLKSALPDEYKV